MKQIDFSNGKVGQNILHSALPMLAAQFLSLLYSIVDRIYIGALPGASVAALAGIGLCFPIVSIITGFANLFGSGGAPLCSISRGAEDFKKAEQILNLSFHLCAWTGIVLTVLIFLFADPILLLFGASSTTLPYASSYLRIYILGTVGNMITLAMNPFLQAQGFSQKSMISVALGAGINILLDPILIFRLNLGVQGAALATIFSQVISCLYVVIFLTSKKTELHLVSIKKVQWNFFLIQDILSLGFATFIMCATNSLVQIVCNWKLSQVGSELYVSIMTVISSIRQILDTPIIALSDGTAPVLGFNYGAGRYGNVKKGIQIMCWMGLGYTAVLWTLILLFPQMFAAIFNREQAFIQAAIPCIRIYFLAFFFQSFQFAGQSVFKSLNKKKQAIFFSLLRKVVIVAPLTLLLPHLFGLGIMGVFLAEPVSNVIGGCACFGTMLKTVYFQLPDQKAPDLQKAANESI